MKKQHAHVSHESIPLFINEQSIVLILGSFPSVKSREEGFYYAHPRNRFFKTLAKVFSENELITIDDRKEFLRKHRIALYDVIFECDIIGSNDSSIINPKAIDLGEILNKYCNIKTIGVNGNKAKKLFDKHLRANAVNHNVNIIYLPSTSSANARMDFEQLVNRYVLMFC